MITSFTDRSVTKHAIFKSQRPETADISVD